MCTPCDEFKTDLGHFQLLDDLAREAQIRESLLQD